MATGLIIAATSGPAWPSVTSEHVRPCRASARRTPQRQFVQTEISDDCKSLLSSPPHSGGIWARLARIVEPLRLEKPGHPVKGIPGSLLVNDNCLLDAITWTT